jgi:exodeoxyribonuclease VII large subunit
LLIESPMQGGETEQGVISALDKIAEYYHLFDLVVIIRVGGSQTDLSWFDSYNIAYHVTQFPLPVITGIGHDKDMTVTDMVAYKSLKTPTAVADFLINHTAGVENHLNEMSSDINDISRKIIEENRSRVETSKIKLLPLTRIMLSEIRERLSGEILEIVNIGKGQISKAGHIPANQESRLISSVKSFATRKATTLKTILQQFNNGTLNELSRKFEKINSLQTNLSMLNPTNVLLRGYTITSINGQIVKMSSLVKKDNIIVTQFTDGKVRSRVLEKKGRG